MGLGVVVIGIVGSAIIMGFSLFGLFFIGSGFWW